MDIFESYALRYNHFSTITEMNMGDRLKQVPSEKFYWASELIQKKRDLDKLNSQKKKIKKNLHEKLLTDSVVALNKKTLDNIEESDVLVEINAKIQESERVVEFLEHIYKCVSYINQDIRNILDFKQLEL